MFPSIEIRVRPRREHPERISLKVRSLRGMQPLVTKFLKLRLIRPCQSPCNTLILPVQKPNGEHHQFV